MSGLVFVFVDEDGSMVKASGSLVFIAELDCEGSGRIN